MLLRAAAFCQLLIFANAILYPKLGKYIGKLTYEMSYKNTKVALKAIEKINTGLFKMDCELALEKVVSDGYDDSKNKNNDPIVDIYIYTVGLSRPRVEVLEEMRDEMQHCKTYAIEKINKYFNANLTDTTTHNFYHKRQTEPDYPEMTPVEFSPNHEKGNPREEYDLAIIDKTFHETNQTNRQSDEELDEEHIAYVETIMKKIKENLKNQKQNETVEEKRHCKGGECGKRHNEKARRRSSVNETEVVRKREEVKREEDEKEEIENEKVENEKEESEKEVHEKVGNEKEEHSKEDSEKKVSENSEHAKEKQGKEEHEKKEKEKTKRHNKAYRSSKSSEKRRSEKARKEAARRRHNKKENGEQEEIATRSNSTSKRSSDKVADKEESQRRKDKQ